MGSLEPVMTRVRPAAAAQMMVAAAMVTDVFGVGGDGWQEVRGGGGCGVGDEGGEEGAG